MAASHMNQIQFPSGCTLVVGGTGGVGAAVCKQLVASGARVAFTYRQNKEKATELLEVLNEQTTVATCLKLDLTKRESIGPIIENARAQFGRIHSCIFCAGSDISMTYISDLEFAQWKEVIEADADGFFQVTKSLLPHFREQQGGSLVLVSSVGTTRFPKQDILSVAPKALMEALVQGIAKEEGRYGTRANTLALGVIDTGIFTRLKEKEFSSEWVDAARQNTALKRFGTADEVARAALFLASNESSYITGQTLYLDGGFHI